MLMAHLRGLLKPDYPNGAMSIIRENMVLQGLSQESEGQHLYTQALMTSSMITAIEPKDRQRSLRAATDNLRMGTSLMRMEAYAKIVRQFKAHSLEANIAALEMLSHTDVFQILEQNLKRETSHAKL
jgi:hypothetical protein